VLIDAIYLVVGELSPLLCWLGLLLSISSMQPSEAICYFDCLAMVTESMQLLGSGHWVIQSSPVPGCN
jgi:hypothetical protein